MLAFLASFCGYALFWYHIQKFKRNQKFILASVWFGVVQLIQFSWMTSTEYVGSMVLIVYLLIAILMGVCFGTLTLFVRRGNLFFVPALLVFMEWGKLHILCGLSWNPVGMALTSNIYSLQFASIFGVLGLSFWVMVSNLAFLQVMNGGKKAISFFLIVLPYIFGVIRINFAEGENFGSLNTILVQTAISPSQKVPWPGRVEEFVQPLKQWGMIIQLIQDSKPDLIVFPEATVPLLADFNYYDPGGLNKIFGIKDLFGPTYVSNSDIAQKISELTGAEVIIGLDYQDKDLKFYSSAIRFSPKTKRDIYSKQVLLPFAEYLPFKWCYEIARKYGITAFFSHGHETKVFEGKILVSPSICYEETFPDIMRKARVKGANLFVNLTNDGWYPKSSLPMQHLYHARVRAVENGIPLLRSCNTGVTASIDSMGRILKTLDDGCDPRAGVLATSVEVKTYKTFYTLFGDLPLILMSGLILLGTSILWRLMPIRL